MQKPTPSNTVRVESLRIAVDTKTMPMLRSRDVTLKVKADVAATIMFVAKFTTTPPNDAARNSSGLSPTFCIALTGFVLYQHARRNPTHSFADIWRDMTVFCGGR